MNVPIFEAQFASILVCALVVSQAVPAQPGQNASQDPQTQSQQTVKPDLPDAPPPAQHPAAPRRMPPASGSAFERITASVPAPVTLLEDTVVTLQTLTPISTDEAKAGDSLIFLVSENIMVKGVLAIPRGATVHGAVVSCKRPGTLTGSPELILKLTSLDLGGQNYPLYSHLFRVKGTSKTRSTEKKVVGGAAVGALVGDINYLQNGGISNKGQAAAMGKDAAIGAGVGTAVAAATPGPEIRIPSEAAVEFSLAAPITVVPVGAAEAERLAEGLNLGGPSLYVRGETP